MRCIVWILAATLVLAGCSSTPTYPGDRTEKRTCRWCSGSGVEAGNFEGPPPPGVRPGGPCVGCRGAKELTVVIPGPKHPAWLKGTVRHGAPMPVEALISEMHQPMKPVTGAVSGAKLHFEGPGKALDITSNNTGRFKLLLEPGHYKVTVVADGFPQKTEEVDVAARQEPIWQERAHLKTEAAAADETNLDIYL